MLVTVLLPMIGAFVVGMLVGSKVARRRTRPVVEHTAGQAAGSEVTPISAIDVVLREALDAFEEGVIVWEADNEVYRNIAATRFVDARHSDSIVEETIARLGRAAMGGIAGAEEVSVYGPPRRVFLVRCQPLHETSIQHSAVAWVRDITEARHLDDVRRDFVANVSHELRTPVGALVLLAETIADEPNAQVVRQFAQRMLRESERLARTVDDLLDLSVIESDTTSLPAPLDLRDVVDAAVAQIHNAATVAGIPIRLGALESATVLGDRRQLVSAIFNLLENAVKYSEPGAAIEIGARCVDGNIEVTVCDQGIGIPTRDLERIFERFYRVDRARSRESGGTGLGLSIVRRIAIAHHGSVRVTSREGEGSTFTMLLPISTLQTVSTNVIEDVLRG